MLNIDLATTTFVKEQSLIDWLINDLTQKRFRVRDVKALERKLVHEPDMLRAAQQASPLALQPEPQQEGPGPNPMGTHRHSRRPSSNASVTLATPSRSCAGTASRSLGLTLSFLTLTLTLTRILI